MPLCSITIIVDCAECSTRLAADVQLDTYGQFWVKADPCPECVKKAMITSYKDGRKGV
jgi:hypothetical protein